LFQSSPLNHVLKKIWDKTNSFQYGESIRREQLSSVGCMTPLFFLAPLD